MDKSKLRKVDVIIRDFSFADKEVWRKDGKGVALFHGFFNDPDGEIKAVIERENGIIEERHTFNVQFIDCTEKQAGNNNE
jgi:hypothetical protein